MDIFVKCLRVYLEVQQSSTWFIASKLYEMSGAKKSMLESHEFGGRKRTKHSPTFWGTSLCNKYPHRFVPWLSVNNHVKSIFLKLSQTDFPHISYTIIFVLYKNDYTVILVWMRHN